MTHISSQPVSQRHSFSAIKQPTALLQQSDVSTEAVIRILQQPCSLRLQSQITVLVQATHGAISMQIIKERHRSVAVELCCQRFSYRFIAPGETITEGDVAGRFHLIIDGSAEMDSNVGKVDLKPGDSFGPVPLVDSESIVGIVTCITPCHCAVLSIPDIDCIRKQLQSLLYQFLLSLPLFDQIPHLALKRLILKSINIHLTLKQVLYRPGDDVSDVFLILEGELELIQDLKIASEGSQIELMLKRKSRTISVQTILGPGELVGDDILNENMRRKEMCQCCAMEAVVLSVPIEVRDRQDFLAIDSVEFWTAIKQRREAKGALHHKRIESLERNKPTTTFVRSESPQPGSGFRSHSFSRYFDVNKSNPLLNSIRNQIFAHESSFCEFPASLEKRKKRDLSVLKLFRKKKKTKEMVSDYSPERERVRSWSRPKSGRFGIRLNAMNVQDVLLKRMLVPIPKRSPSHSPDLLSKHTDAASKQNQDLRNSKKLAASRRNLLKGFVI